MPATDVLPDAQGSRALRASVEALVSAAKGEADKPQVDKFRDLARQLEADEDEAHFEEAVKKIVRAPRPEKADKPE